MAIPDIAKRAKSVEASQPETWPVRKPFWLKAKIFRLHRIAWLCLLLACLGTSWFAYQYTLVPQPAHYTPTWGGAQWMQASDDTINQPVAYFRYVTNLDTSPDGAFVTVAANQVFRLYINGTFVGTNAIDFSQGNPHAYIYDIASLLHAGPDVVALRVANLDQQIPSARVSLGIVRGENVYYQGSGNGWQATVDSAAAHPRYVSNQNIWTTLKFDASSWLAVQQVANAAAPSTLEVNPLVYEQPVPTHWMSAGVGNEAYFVRQIAIPFGSSDTWLRIAASGSANIFINGHLLMAWNSQPPISPQKVADYISNNQAVGRYRYGFALGIYDIAPYLHTGENTIAVHVLAPGISSTPIGRTHLKATMIVDMLVTDNQGHNSWLTPDRGWHASPQSIDGWQQGDGAALSWPSPIFVGRPGTSSIFYLPDRAEASSMQFLPFSQISRIILLSVLAVLAPWLLLSLFLTRRYYLALRQVLEVMSLAYLPALAVETLLVILAGEPQLPRPFPYTWYWGITLVLLVGLSYLVLCLNICNKKKHPIEVYHTGITPQTDRVSNTYGINVVPQYDSRAASDRDILHFYIWARKRVLSWLSAHWLLVLIIVFAIPLISYNLAYEPYWQDELTSLYAAKGILIHALPILPSGFLYPKGELYSYMLALSLLIFGDQGAAPRILSAAEYLISLPVLYGIGCYFFERRVAVLATAMLALSPIALLWGREVRMYEQIQVFTPIVLYLFYRALQERQRVRYVYLAVAVLVIDYLSHEEIFIILPAILACVFVFSAHSRTHNSTRRPWVLYQKHWWYAAAIATAIIGTQLLIVVLSHPPVLGTDQSQRPLIQLTMDNIPYYFKLLFFPRALNSTLPWITLNSILAIVGCGLAIRSGDTRAKYCALFFIVSFLTLIFIFTLASERYIFPVLPLYYLLGAYALVRSLRALWNFARSHFAQSEEGRRARPIPTFVGEELPTIKNRRRFMGTLSSFWQVKVMAAIVLALVIVSVLLAPILPLSNYSPFVSKVTGSSYHRHYPDYDAVGQYMRQHWKKGDVVIAVSPAISVLYYVGHVNYFFSVNRALYLFERDGHIIDTPTGSIALLNQDDFQAVLATHARIWLISDNGLYQAGALKAHRFVFPPDFHLVFEGYGSAVYYRGS